MEVTESSANPIVISGISGRFSGASNISELWDRLCNGEILYGPDKTPYPKVLQNAVPKARGFIKDSASFDNEFFGLSKEEANLLDGQIRLLYEVTYESFLDAGILPNEWYQSRTGVFLGTFIDDTDMTPRSSPTYQSIPSRLAYQFNLRGPSIRVDTACASSLTALQLAKLSIEAGECDQAIVAGVCLHQRSFLNASLVDFGILSKRGLSSPLDIGADGYIRSEAIIAMIVQRKSSAKRIYSEVIGIKSNTDGYTQEGITFPNRYAQKAAMIEALKEANVSPSTINYIEAHLTGTQAGDKTECLSILDAYRSQSQQSIQVGALKSNLGHTEAAAGLASLTKASLILKHSLIPPMIPPQEKNPEIESLIKGQIVPVLEKQNFPDNLLAVNAFGFGGANVHVILKGNEITESSWSSPKERLILLANRTKHGIEKTFELLEKNGSSRSDQFLSLLDHISTIKPESGMIFRAYGTVCENGLISKKVINQVTATRQFGVVILSPLAEISTQLSTLPEFCDHLNRAKAAEPLSPTVIFIELLHLLNLNVDIVLGFDSLIVQFCAGIKSFKETIAVQKKGHERSSVPIDPKVNIISSLVHYLNSSVNYPDDNRGLVDGKFWSSKCFVDQSDRSLDNIDFLIIDGDIRLVHGTEIMTNNWKSIPSVQSIWQLIGELYLRGYHIDFSKIHPKVEYPVHRDCPSISPLIQWNHSNHFYDNLYPDYFSPSNATIHHIDLFDPEYANIADHIIDGKVLMPAAGFIYLIGKHLGIVGFESPKQVGQFTFRTWDVKFLEACPMNDEVDIFVIHDPVTFKFVIRSDESLFVTGSASVGPSSFSDVNSSDNSIEFSLRPGSVQDDDEFKHSDVYQYVRLRGYHFGRTYRKVQRIKASRSIAYVKYSGDWIAFLDSLLQIDQFWEKTRLLKVPTSLKNFCFDFELFNRSLEEFKDPEGSQSLMVFSPAYGYINTFGFNLESIGWKAIKRRDFDEPKIATVKFQSYSDNQITLTLQQITKRQEYHQTCLSALTANEIDIETDIDQSLLRFIAKLNRPEVALPSILERESSNLWNDILTNWPDSALNCVLDVVLSNCKRLGMIKIGYLDHLSKLHRDKIIERAQNHRKFCEFVNISTESVSKLHDIDLILITDASARLLPLSKSESFDNILTRLNISNQHFVLIQYRSDHSLTEKEILNRLSLQSISNGLQNLQLNETLGYVKVGQSCVGQSFTHFELYRKKIAAKSLSIQNIKISNDSYNWVDEIKQSLLRNDLDRVWLIAECNNSGIYGLFNCLSLESNGEKLRFCHFSTNDAHVPIDSNEINAIIEKDLRVNIKRHGSWGYMTLENVDLERENAVLSDHYYFTFEKAGAMDTLKWTEHYSKTICSTNKLIKVAYSAINFRDALIASGIVPVEAYPVENFYDLGIEFSGINADGQRVMGAVQSKGFASYIPIDSVVFMFPVPDHWSLKDAATIPVCYMSAYYGLIIRGGLKPGETVLIHSGSGGVGIAAISIALNLGCKVFTTVSSHEKRSALISMFPQLDESTSFADSRSTSFEDHILIQTKGRGVDMVLNSLTDDKLIAGIRCLASGGRFIDLSKKDFIQDSPIDKFQLEDNKTFETVCLVYLATSVEDNLRSKAALKMIDKLFETGFETGQIVPLPSKVYDRHSIEKAFKEMRTGQHIGKLLVQVNEVNEKGNIQVEPLLASRRTYFCPSKSYLIVGGLGGMGLELVRWLVSRGARKIVISSRSGLKTGYQRLCLKNIRDFTHNQATIVIVRFDLTNFRGSARAIRETTRLGPLGGIFNLAAVLRDNLFEKQTKETFQLACDSKIAITKNLDKISRSECNDLDYFVCFSSIAVQGNLGQTNYAYGNSFMETICESRRQDGLPGLAIEWGPIADVGLAARTFGADKQAISSYQNQSVDSFLKVLDTLLGLNEPICYSAIPVATKATKSSDIFTRVARIMGLKDIGSVDHNKTLRELGIDSVQSIEVQIYLSQELKQSIKQFTIAELTLNDLKTMSSAKSSGPESIDNLAKEKIFVPLNDKDQNTIFFFPPAIADFLSMTPLAQELDCQVIGINYTDEALENSQFDQITDLFYSEITKAYPNVPKYLFVGYSLGVMISYDVARKIQSRLGTDRADTIVFIDASPYGHQQSLKHFRRLRELGGFTWESMRDPRMSMDKKQMKNDRLKIVSVLENITGTSDEKNTEVFFGFWDKMAAIIDLKFDQKFIGKVLHYQAIEQPTALLDNLNSNMGAAIDGPIDTRMVKSNHFEIMNHAKTEILAGINELLSFKNKTPTKSTETKNT